MGRKENQNAQVKMSNMAWLRSRCVHVSYLQLLGLWKAWKYMNDIRIHYIVWFSKRQAARAFPEPKAWLAKMSVVPEFPEELRSISI